jgi:sarcosine oxidase
LSARGSSGSPPPIELRDRGHAITLFEQGTAPNEAASSTDTSKTIRRLYGDNGTYVELVERAALQWGQWHDRLEQSIYFRTGQLQIERDFRPGFRIHDSWRFLRAQDKDVRILTNPEARVRYPQFAYEDGETCLYDPWGGYIASSLAIAGLTRLARDGGVVVLEETPVREVSDASSSVHVLAGGRRLRFDRAVVAAGVWMTRLVPQIGRHILPTRQEMVFFEPPHPAAFAAGVMPVWSVNVETEGWYGHPLRHEGWVKVANDLRGEVVDPDAPRVASSEFLDASREFVARRIPQLAQGRLVASRVCLYENTPDRHFVIDWVPGSRGILVAGGGSGHGFKFGGSIGGVIADALEHKLNALGDPFRIGQRFG